MGMGNMGNGGFGSAAGMGGIFGGATIGQNEMCPATNIAKNCMAPSTLQNFNMMQKMMLERQCAAKECCWDNARYQQSLMMQSGTGSVSNLLCAWRVPDYSMYGMPSLTYSLRGCCDYSPCVERKGRDGSYIPPAPPANTPINQGPINQGPVNQGPVQVVRQGAAWSLWSNWSQCSSPCESGTNTRTRECSVANECGGRNLEEKVCYTNCDPVVYSPWSSYGCSRTCGGGYETVYRTCISGPCPTPQEIKHNQPCNQDISCGGWGIPWWG